jgi:NADPH:quinone reductase-like Zn-dependent oxidoreductase
MHGLGPARGLARRRRRATYAAQGRGPHPHDRDIRDGERMSGQSTLVPSTISNRRTVAARIPRATPEHSRDRDRRRNRVRRTQRQRWKAGCYAEYVCYSANGIIAAKPANLTYEEAAALPYGGLLALHIVRKAAIKPGQRVLVYGASGAIGTAAVQLAKHFGATVTGVCGPTNLALVDSLGADSVVDYTREDFTTSGERYDVILDAVGRRKSAKVMLRAGDALAPGGKAISIDDDFPKMNGDDLLTIKRLAESGELKPVIDRRYALDDMVEAHRYVDLGHKRGNVIVTIGTSA